ncbi:MAG: hypothetical protein R3Y36_03045 [Spirochaetales bacterium]
MRVGIKNGLATVFIFLFSFYMLGAESFRVHSVTAKQLSEQTTAIQVSLSPGDALYIKVPEENLFLLGAEMKMKIPAAATQINGAIAYAFYGDISPTPHESIIDYSGTQLLIDTLPGRLSYHMKIPFVETPEIQEDPYTEFIPIFFNRPVKDIFFHVYIVMKGVPDTMANAVFDIEVKPIVLNAGLLDLNILYPQVTAGETTEQPFVVFIDEEIIDFKAEPLLLKTGVHHLTVVSDFYRNEVRTFTVGKTQQTNLEIQLRDITPVLAISAPENTRFFMNNVEYTEFTTPFTVQPGSYQLRFVLGDYEVIKTAEIVNGKTYTIDVSFDVNIAEE